MTRRSDERKFFERDFFDDPLFVFFIKMDKTYFHEERYRAIFERLLNHKFKKVRPS